MVFLLVGVLVVVVALLVLLGLRRQKPMALARQGYVAEAPPVPLPGAGQPVVANGAVHGSAEAGAEPLAPRQGPLPAELAAFVWAQVDVFPDARRQALLERLRAIPRPPHALHKLLSQEFLASASSTELGELIKGEPLIAAKVLAAVNAPMYGLQKPVASLGQAVTFLGLNTVRGLCAQYMLDALFKAEGPEQQKVFDAIWSASAAASNLCARLGQKLALPDQGALVTQVVLYFLGQVAAYALLPTAVAARLRASAGLLERMRVEQEQLGLNASEVGALLMREWVLPDSIIADVRDIDHVLDTPVDGVDPARRARQALCYLCARLGEGLAAGQTLDALMADVLADAQPEFWHLQDYLRHPTLVRLPEVLQSMD